jgi:FAD/FMN-containing dehydrogenase
MLGLFENMEGHYQDAFICESQTQMESFWKIRESISMGTAQYGLVNTINDYFTHI